MGPTVAAFVLLFLLTGLVEVVNRTSGARRPGTTVDDRKSSMVLGFTHTAVLISAIVFPVLGVGRLAVGSAFAWTAVAVMVLAFAGQVWAMRTLGEHFKFVLATDDGQPLVERGPYRKLRHPGYLAQIVFFLAFGAAMQNAWTLAVVTVAVAIGYAYRIRTEERMLARAFGERWAQYASERARLVPGVY